MIADNINEGGPVLIESDTKQTPFNSVIRPQEASTKSTAFKLFLKPSTGQIRLEESLNQNNINISLTLRDFRELTDEPFRKRKRIMVDSTVSPDEKTCDTPTLDHQNSLTRPWSFLQVIKRKKNKSEFLKNYAFTFEELFEFESKYRHYLFDSKIHNSPDCQADLRVLGNKKFRSYIPGSFSQGFSSHDPVFKMKCAETRSILAKRLSIKPSDSQILRLMSLCPSEEMYWFVLETEDTLIREFFGTN